MLPGVKDGAFILIPLKEVIKKLVSPKLVSVQSITLKEVIKKLVSSKLVSVHNITLKEA